MQQILLSFSHCGCYKNACETGQGKNEKEINLAGCSLKLFLVLVRGHYGSRDPRPLNSVPVLVKASPVQVVLPHVVVLEHPHQLDILADEAGGQQAVGPQLQTLLQGECHALWTQQAVITTVTVPSGIQKICIDSLQKSTVQEIKSLYSINSEPEF